MASKFETASEMDAEKGLGMSRRFNSSSQMKRALGLGSAKSGVSHWWGQRVTAAGNVILAVWFLASILLLPAYDRVTVVTWIASPLTAVPLLLLIVSVFWHARLGMQVMLEDYIHSEGLKLLSFVALNFFIILVAMASAFSVLTIAFGGFRA